MLRVNDKKKVDDMQEQIGNVSMEMETPKENPKEMLEIKNTVADMEKSLGGVYWQDVAKARISELEERSMITSQTEMQRENKEGEKQKSRNSGTISKGIIYA